MPPRHLGNGCILLVIHNPSCEESGPRGGKSIDLVRRWSVYGRSLVMGKVRESSWSEERLYPASNGVEWVRAVKRAIQMVGECWSRLEAASSNVESRLGRSVTYIQTHSIIV